MPGAVLLGIDIGGTNVKVGMVTAAGEIVDRDEFPTNASDGPALVAARANRWFDEHLDDRTVAGAGVACAGLLDSERGFLYHSPNLPGWDEVDLADVFSNELSLPVTVDNDVNCAVYGEFRNGAGRGVRHFACLTLGTGVGGGLVIDGRLHRGFQGIAGEIGHTIIQADGPTCVCGCRGCVEAMIGASAIVDRAKRLLAGTASSILRSDEDFTVKDIAAAAAAGDEPARATLEETGWYLGLGLVSLAHLLDPEVIAVGGGVAGSGELILGPARRTFEERVMNPIFREVRIVPAELGNNASFLGAALLAGERSG